MPNSSLRRPRVDGRDKPGHDGRGSETQPEPGHSTAIAGDRNIKGAQLRALGRQWNPSAFPDQAERPLARTKRGEFVERSPLAPRQSFLNWKNPMRQNRETKWRLTP